MERTQTKQVRFNLPDEVIQKLDAYDEMDALEAKELELDEEIAILRYDSRQQKLERLWNQQPAVLAESQMKRIRADRETCSAIIPSGPRKGEACGRVQTCRFHG